MSSGDELWSNTSSSCDVESLELAVEGKALLIRSFSTFESGSGRRRRDGGRRGRRRLYTLSDLGISLRKQGNSVKLVSYKSAMPSM